MTTMTADRRIVKAMGDAAVPMGARRGLPRVLLASKSPRRRELLREFGIAHQATATGVDDGLLLRGGVTPMQWVAALAYFKAAAAHATLAPADAIASAPGTLVILGADTVVRKDNEVIGQPGDAADAERILRTLENGEHEVLTGVAFIDAATGHRDMFTDSAQVRVGSIGPARIEAYVASGTWAGKAGAYNLRERLDAGWPIEYEGDPTTIMGLPMAMLAERLAEFARACPGSMAP